MQLSVKASMEQSMETEASSTTITIEIQRRMSEAARLRKVNRADPNIKVLMTRIDELAQRRRSLIAA